MAANRAQSAESEAHPDLLDPSFWVDDPHDAFTPLRATSPVWRDEQNGLWAVLRHADVHDVERRDHEFVSGRGYRSFDAPGETNMIAQDDPRHQAQRGLVSRRFTPRSVRNHESWIRETVGDLIDEMSVGSSAELVHAFAAQLPCRLTARLLGWDEDRWTDIKSWSERLMRYDQLHRDPEVAAGMSAAISDFAGDLVGMLDVRRSAAADGCPVDDLVGVWATEPVDGERLDFESVIHETGLFISGGAETTRTVIARGIRAFCDHPEQWEMLADQPEMIPAAVEEMIRWVTPLNNFFRTAVVDTSIGDQPVRSGDRVMLVYPSANRDETVFDRPFDFDVTRSPNPHIGFGFGTHFCLGASLARFELGIVLEQLVSRLTDLHVVSEPDLEPNIFATAVRSFDLGFRVR